MAGLDQGRSFDPNQQQKSETTTTGTTSITRYDFAQNAVDVNKCRRDLSSSKDTAFSKCLPVENDDLPQQTSEAPNNPEKVKKPLVNKEKIWLNEDGKVSKVEREVWVIPDGTERSLPFGKEDKSEAGKVEKVKPLVNEQKVWLNANGSVHRAEETIWVRPDGTEKLQRFGQDDEKETTSKLEEGNEHRVYRSSTFVRVQSGSLEDLAKEENKPHGVHRETILVKPDVPEKKESEKPTPLGKDIQKPSFFRAFWQELTKF